MTRELRTTFEEEPELYDRVRPTYPPAIFDDITTLTRLPAGARICEIGCGTGQATLPLAERGYRITCVELGTQLAAVAARKLARFPDVEIVNEDVERWRPERADFDAVVAFTAFHWLDPERRFALVASLLHERGTLALVTTQHVLPEGGDDFFAEVQADYEAVLPDDPQTQAGGPPPPAAVAGLEAEIAASGVFRNVAARRYVWDVSYDADAYEALLLTYSGHRALDEERRADLLRRIRRRIEARPGGRVRKTYLALLNVSSRR